MIDVVNWAAQSTVLLSPYGNIPKLIDPEAWRDWARAVIALPAIAAVGAPRPEGFQHWQDWGRQFNVVARLLTA